MDHCINSTEWWYGMQIYHPSAVLAAPSAARNRIRNLRRMNVLREALQWFHIYFHLSLSLKDTSTSRGLWTTARLRDSTPLSEEAVILIANSLMWQRRSPSSHDPQQRKHELHTSIPQPECSVTLTCMNQAQCLIQWFMMYLDCTI